MHRRNERRWHIGDGLYREFLLCGLILLSGGLVGCGGGGDGLTDTQTGVEQYALAISPDGRSVASGGTFVTTSYGAVYPISLGIGAAADTSTTPSDPGPVEDTPPDDPPIDTGSNSGSSDSGSSSSGDTSTTPPDQSNAGVGTLDSFTRRARRVLQRVTGSPSLTFTSNSATSNSGTGRGVSSSLLPLSQFTASSRSANLFAITRTSTQSRSTSSATSSLAYNAYTSVPILTPLRSARGQATVPKSNGRYVDQQLEGRIWFANAQTGAVLNVAKLGQIVYALAYSPDGTMLASGSQDRLLRLLDAQSGAVRQTFTGHGDRVAGVAFSPDGTRLASAGFNDHTVRIWDIASGALVNTLSTGKAGATCVAFSPDGKSIAGGEGNGSVTIWDASSGAVLHTLNGNQYATWAVAFSPDGKQLANGSADSKVNIWDTQSGSLRLTLVGHTNFVYAVRFSRDGKLIASGSSDRSVRLWDSTTGALVNNVPVPSAVQGLDFTPDNTAVIVAGVDGDVQSLSLSSGQPAWQQTVN